MVTLRELTDGPLGVVLGALRVRGAKIREGPTGWTATCPAHDDRHPSLSIAEGDDGRVLLHRHAGCEPTAIVAVLGLEMLDLFCDPLEVARGRIGAPVAEYDYRDESGRLLFQVVRFEPKAFRQRRPDGKGGWTWGLGDTRRVLFLLPELLAADPTEPVFIVEGEKDALNLAGLGVVATCNPMGAGKWRDEYGAALAGRRVVVIPDNDEPGRAHALAVTRSLHGISASVKIVDLPDLPPSGDISDWIARGGTREDLTGLEESAPAWLPDMAQKPEDRQQENHHRATPESDADSDWPNPLEEIAFHGLVGDFVRLVELHTEADPVALLVQFHVGFGSLVGRGPYCLAESDRHYTNLFTCLAGETSKGRKGTAWGRVRVPLRAADETWAVQRIQTGLSSGEGLIWAVRDAIMTQSRIRDKDGDVAYKQVEEDPGIQDKRLLVLETEFASTLRVMSREGSTLSPIIRLAWDSGDLRAMTKNSPAAATGAHISIIGHITEDELRRYLDRTEIANGFANRFLWICVRRARYLPEGGSLGTVEFAPLQRRLQEAVEFARKLGPTEVRRDAEARCLWCEVYRDLSEGRPGLLGAVVSRAEAQVTRLALLYALLDCSYVIRRVHLKAALALWRYAEASARHIFGDALGDPVADQILVALRSRFPEGLTRTEISALFGRNRSAERIGAALLLLLKHGLARFQPESTPGRSAERWFALLGTKETKKTKEG